jgi:farnesyl diphosphate synthase
MAAMCHGALGGGKRLRPFLLIETAGLFGVSAAAALPAAAAIELIHCYSLIHDDLPSMDNDDLRRGQPTVHRAFDEATAILAGDGLLTLAFEVLAEPASSPDPAIRAELVLALARASGLAGMVGGQMLDLEAEGRFAEARRTAPPWPGDVRRLQAMKTGALLAAAVDMGAVLGKASRGQRLSLSTFGQSLGACFQVADDILDVEASAEAMGKATAKDADAGKATLVAAIGLEAARQERDRLSADAAGALRRFGPEADILRVAARFAAERTS